MSERSHIDTQNWENAKKVQLKNLEPYKYLFPKPDGIDQTVLKNAGVSHTVAFIPKVVKQCAWQVEKFVQQELKNLPLDKACAKLWQFVRFHVEWVRDEDGKEQVRSPRRLIGDGKGDCDCMTTFVDTCMSVYGVKGIINRIVAYDGNTNFSHIYSLIPDGKGSHYIIDCCYPQFNKEKTHTKKEDYNMELQFLDGIEDTNKPIKGTNNEDMEGLDNIMGELGKLLKRNTNKQGGGGVFKKKTGEQKEASKEKRKTFVKKAGKFVNKINKINPATVLLRAGILASMKLNVMKVAERIKWGYATEQLAESKGMDMSKYGKIKNILAKAEQIFFVSGGKRENLRHAILTGKGNRNKEVAGLDGYNGETPLPTLLGAIYQDEFINGMEGVEGLGEPATAASLTAAAGAMGSLAALLAAVGNLFPNKGKTDKKPNRKNKKQITEESEDAKTTEETPSEQTPEQEPESSETAPEQESENTPATTQEAEPPAEASETETSSEENTEEEKTEETTEGLSGLMGIKAFYEANKNWINPVASFAAGALTTALLYEIFSSTKKPSPQLSGLEGTKNKDTQTDGDDKQSVIALM